MFCVIVLPAWWSYDNPPCQKLCPVCDSSSLQCRTVSTDYSRIPLTPLRPLGRTWNQLGYRTYPEVTPSVWDADSVQNFQVHSGHHDYQYNQPQVSTMSHVGVSQCHGVCHVTSSLPVNPGPRAHVGLLDRNQLFVGDYNNPQYQQTDMRTDDVAFPVPIEARCISKPSNQFGEVWLSDSAIKQMEYNGVISEKQNSLETTTTQVTNINVNIRNKCHK